MTSQSKRCTSCGKCKKLTEFYRDSRFTDRLCSRCKTCKHADVRAWRERNPKKVEAYNIAYRPLYRERSRGYRLKNLYKLTVDQFNALAKRQKNKCAICKRRLKLCVDHCHQSKQVRGLLCHSCNRGLGSFKDSKRWLSNALRYLRKS